MKPVPRMFFGVGCAALIVLGALWICTLTLHSHAELYDGQPFEYWQSELSSSEEMLRSRASNVISTAVIPQLCRQMFSDTNDSSFRMAVIDQLNNLPGVQVIYVPAAGRRVAAVNALSALGTNATMAVPELLRALRSKDDLLCGPAAAALVKIGADAEGIVPALIECLSDENGHGRPEVVEALGEYGQKAKTAVPLLVKLLEDKSSKELMMAVPQALKKIDPEAASRPQ
jgi:HEAT repeat protein